MSLSYFYIQLSVLFFFFCPVIGQLLLLLLLCLTIIGFDPPRTRQPPKTLQLLLIGLKPQLTKCIQTNPYILFFLDNPYIPKLWQRYLKSKSRVNTDAPLNPNQQFNRDFNNFKEGVTFKAHLVNLICSCWWW